MTILNNVSAIVNNVNIKQRADGRYEGRISIRGTRKSFYGSSKTEVKQEIKDYLLKVENGFKEPKKIRLNEYIEYWLTTYKWNKIEPSSYTRLYRVYECQIKNTIGQKMIGNISTQDIQKMVDDHANPPDNQIKPLALSGLKRIVHLLNPCFEMAVKEGIVSENPCADVILPVESCILTETRVQNSLSDEEMEVFKQSALKRYKTTGDYCSRDGLVLLLIMNLGLRVGEMLALEWNDINMEEKLIHINKTVQSNIKSFNKDSGQSIYNRVKKSAKTRSGVRVLPLNDNTLGYIQELKWYDVRHGIKSPYVCCTSAGTRQSARNLQRSLDRITARTNIPYQITLHTLRHTFGSVLVRRGIGIEVVSKLMGHANINITYSKYIHVIQEQEAKAMEIVQVC